MNYQENYCSRPHYEDCCLCPICHTSPCCCECNCECNCKCKKACECGEPLNLYVRDKYNQCCSCEHPTCCEHSFSSYLCQFINKKVMITIGCKRLRVVVLEVSCSTVKCLLLGAGKLVYLNVDRIDNVRPLSC